MTKYLLAICAVIQICSCSAPKYITGTPVTYTTTTNTFCFGALNLDDNAKIDNSNFTCHYNGFDIQYILEKDFTLSFVIINNSNKSLLIDKSKCYVLYDGYATQLFKDVHSSRSTTFNNVQDAINNVQTNEASVLMTIPPYSKWQLPITECNIRPVNKLPNFSAQTGTRAISQYDNQEVTEYVIPYSYDYSMAKWETCRNRLFVNSVTCATNQTMNDETVSLPIWLSSNQYLLKHSAEPDWTEANRIDAINMKKYRKHNAAVRAGYLFWGIIFPGCKSHYPTLYGKNGSTK